VEPVCNGAAWAYYGLDASCTYDDGTHNTGALTSPTIALPVVPQGGVVTLSYCSTFTTENEDGYDVAGVYVNDFLMDVPTESAAWEVRDVDLTPWAGQPVFIEWRFDTIDDYYNDYRGWQVDAIRIVASDVECASDCPADVNGDDAVNVDDLFGVINHWGAGAGPYDVNGDGVVDIDDLFGVLSAWGPCP
jgi:hypothetical protein